MGSLGSSGSLGSQILLQLPKLPKLPNSIKGRKTMKKCPVCEKTFDDSMRFCQTDGTPLLDFVEEPPEDPLKTTVVRQEEIASAIPAEDSFRSPIAETPAKDDSGDLLQLPEEFDPMKTVVARSEPKIDLNFSEPQRETPVYTPFESKIEEKPSDFTAPEPPKFSEPSLSPPNFGDMSAPSSYEQPKDEPPPTAIYMPESSPFSSAPQTPMSSSPFDRPMEKPLDTPIPSPFSDAPKPQIPAFQETLPPPQSNSPFDQPSPFGGMEQQNQGFNQPVQQSDWTPPTPPVSNWQDQGLGANTPFQPPAAGVGQDSTLAIVSLVLGIASFICSLSLLASVPAVITGFMHRNNVKKNPNQYGGDGLALAGMIIGGINVVLSVLAIGLWILLILGSR